MGSFSIWHWLIVLLVVVLIFGTKKLRNLGTDLGVLTSIDAGRTWMTEETGFGPAVTMWLSLIRTPSGQKQLFAFTHGRGAWRVTLG